MRLTRVPVSEHERERLLAVARTVEGVISDAKSGLGFDKTPWSFSTFLMQSNPVLHQDAS